MPQIDIVTALDSSLPSSPPPSLARYLVLIFREFTREDIREAIRDTDLSGPINAEHHFLVKEYSHFERVCVAGVPALRVWKYLFFNASISTPPYTIDAWLEEA